MCYSPGMLPPDQMADYVRLYGPWGAPGRIQLDALVELAKDGIKAKEALERYVIADPKVASMDELPNYVLEVLPAKLCPYQIPGCTCAEEGWQHGNVAPSGPTGPENGQLADWEGEGGA